MRVPVTTTSATFSLAAGSDRSADTPCGAPLGGPLGLALRGGRPGPPQAALPRLHGARAWGVTPADGSTCAPPAVRVLTAPSACGVHIPTDAGAAKILLRVPNKSCPNLSARSESSVTASQGARGVPGGEAGRAVGGLPRAQRKIAHDRGHESLGVARVKHAADAHAGRRIVAYDDWMRRVAADAHNDVG